jgi:hypothetical protein
MKARPLFRFVAGLALIISMLTACGGGGGIEINSNVGMGGIEFPTENPQFYAEVTYTTELPITTHMRIRLEAISGDIELEGRYNINSMTLTAYKRVGSDSQLDANLNLNQLDVLVDDQTDQILIRTLQPQNTQGRQYTVDYHIIVPEHLVTEVILDNGDINAWNLQNWLSVDAMNGNVYLSNLSGSVSVDLSSGSISSSMALPLHGQIILFTDNGDIDLDIPSSTSATFAALVTNGLISTSNLEFFSVIQTPHSLNGSLGNGEGMIDLETINGNINVVGLN